jgi:hypothetical protein
VVVTGRQRGLRNSHDAVVGEQDGLADRVDSRRGSVRGGDHHTAGGAAGESANFRRMWQLWKRLQAGGDREQPADGFTGKRAGDKA